MPTIEEENNFSGLKTADNYYSELQKYPPLKSGNKYLDDLLEGGFRKGLVHLLIGPRKKNTEILLRTAVMAFMPKSNGGLGVQKVAYIDGNNRFSPYFISQLALSMNMNPREILSNIYVARAFNWSQMVEITQLKLSQMKGIGLALISGFTDMFETVTGDSEGINQKSFEDLKNGINGIKKTIEKSEPIVIISAAKHEMSLHKPIGGKILTHFGCVIVEILERERYTDYLLAQHPFMPQKNVVKWNRISEQIMDRYTRWGMDHETEYNADHETEHSTNYEIKHNTDYKIEHNESDEERYALKRKLVPNNQLKTNSQEKNHKKWHDTIQKTPSNGYIKKLNNLRLKEKRNRTNKKGTNDKHQDLTLDYYIDNIKRLRKS